MTTNKRAARRVGFERAIDAAAIAVDGTWSIKGHLENISATGAKLHVFDQITARMRSEEFFLVMTPDGKVKRRSKLIWEEAGQIGIGFTTASEG